MADRRNRMKAPPPVSFPFIIPVAHPTPELTLTAVSIKI